MPADARIEIRAENHTEQAFRETEQELRYLASVNPDVNRIHYFVENWDYREMGHITIGNFRPGPDGGYTITDGNHRSVALALLLTTNRITYQPVTAITAITQTQTRHRVYEDEYSQTR